MAFSKEYWDKYFGPPIDIGPPATESDEEKKRRRELEVLQQKSQAERVKGEEAQKFLEKPWYKQVFTKRTMGEVFNKQALKKTGAAALERLGTTARALGGVVKVARAPAPGEEIKPKFKELPGAQILKTPDITVGERVGRGAGTLIGMLPEFYLPGVAEEAITAKVATRIPQATSFLMKAVRSMATRAPGMAAAGATFRVQAGAIEGKMPTVKDVAEEAGLWTAFSPIPGFMKWASKAKIGRGVAEQIEKEVAKEITKVKVTDITKVPKGTEEARLRPPVTPQPGFDITGKRVAKDTGLETSLFAQADREAGAREIIGETRPTLPGETFRGNLAQTLEGQQQTYQVALQEREAFDSLLGKNLIDETKKVLRSRAYANGEIDVAGIPGFNEIVRSVRMGTGRDYTENEILDVIANLKTKSELAKMKPISLGEYKPDIVPPSEPVFRGEPGLGTPQQALGRSKILPNKIESKVSNILDEESQNFSEIKNIKLTDNKLTDATGTETFSKFDHKSGQLIFNPKSFEKETANMTEQEVRSYLRNDVLPFESGHATNYKNMTIGELQGKQGQDVANLLDQKAIKQRENLPPPTEAIPPTQGAGGVGELPPVAEALPRKITGNPSLEEYRYHITDPAKINSIRKSGLKPSRGQYGKGVYFAPTEEGTTGWGRETGTMIRTKIKNLPPDYDEFPKEQGWTENIVPPENLEIKTDQGWRLLVEKKVLPPTPEAVLPLVAEVLPPVGEGRALTSGLAKNTEKLAVENKLATDFGNLPEYQKMNMKEQASKAVDFIDSDPERALNVALGRELSPPGLYPENVYTAIKLRALKSGDGETLRLLATSPEINAQATVLGQRIKSLDDQLMNDPVKDMRQVIEYRVNLGKPGEVTIEEAKKIADNSWKVQEKAFSLQNDFTFKGFEDATHKKNLVDYFIAKRKAENYIQFLTPTSKIKVVFSTIGRGNMLLSAKSTLVNIISNTVRGATAFLERRTQALKIGGANNKFAAEYMKFANEVYDKSGYDITRMLSLEDVAMIRQGEKVLSAQGPGAIRRVGRFYEDLVYKRMLGKPDLLASSFSFADSANLTSTALAKKEGLKGGALIKRAREIFQDATNPSPITVNGKLVRDQAIKDATYDTYTNMSLSSKFALGIRKLINLVTGNIGVGEFVEPFAKTPANVAEAGLDAAGLGGVKALYQLPRAFKAAKAGEELAFRPVIQNLIKAGVGITGAYLLVSMIKPEDYIGEYPTTPKEKQLFDLNQATANSLKIAGKWISLDYFGPLAAPMVGMLYVKKYGKEGATLANIGKYIQGAVTQISKIPGVQEITGLGATITKKLAAPALDIGEEIQSLYNDAVSGLTARLIPAIVSDISKASDKLQRKTDYKKPLTKLQEKIPGWRTGLPEKKTMFGETKYGEPWWLQILSGARIRTATDNNLINELNRLQKSGNLPALSNIEYSTGRVAEFKKQVPKEKFDQFVNEFQAKLKQEFQSTLMDVEYISSSDEEKAKMINSAKNKVLDDALEKHGYKKPEKETTKLKKIKPGIGGGSIGGGIGD